MSVQHCRSMEEPVKYGEKNEVYGGSFYAAAFAGKRPKSAVQTRWNEVNGRDCTHPVDEINDVNCGA